MAALGPNRPQISSVFLFLDTCLSITNLGMALALVMARINYSWGRFPILEHICEFLKYHISCLLFTAFSVINRPGVAGAVL